MFQFLLRYAVKAVVYYGVLIAFMAIGLLVQTPEGLIPLALILAGVNTVIRPFIVAIALPFNLLTFGIASVFANLLTLVIANAIAGGALATGFWVMLLISLVVMLVDDGIRNIRKAIRLKRADV
jgi:putative membrane protein